MYKNTFRKIKPTLVAAMLGYNLLSPHIAHAQSNTADVSVSVTVIGPAETETRTVDQSGKTSAWERVAPETSSIDYYIEDDDYSWLDYVSPRLQQVEAKRVESQNFYDNLSHENGATRGNDLFEVLKSTVLQLFPLKDLKDEYGF